VHTGLIWNKSELFQMNRMVRILTMVVNKSAGNIQTCKNIYIKLSAHGAFLKLPSLNTLKVKRIETQIIIKLWDQQIQRP